MKSIKTNKVFTIPALLAVLAAPACTVVTDGGEDDDEYGDDDRSDDDAADDDAADDDAADDDAADDDAADDDDDSGGDDDSADGGADDDGSGGDDDSADGGADDDTGDDVAEDDDTVDGGAADDTVDGGAPATEDAGPSCETPEDLDTDEDGIDDGCDEDDDNDGFIDADDPEPKNAAVPGDYSSPEKILEDPLVQDALEQLEADGIDFPIFTERSAPELSQYYVREDGLGSAIATSNGTDLGRPLVGHEMRITSGEDDTFDSVAIGFTDGAAISFSFSFNQMLRGEGDSFTIYALNKLTCTESASNYSTWRVSLTSGVIDPATGSQLDIKSLGVTIAADGELTSACASRGLANTEIVGGWSLFEASHVDAVTGDELAFMCVDESMGYVPTESWENTDGAACSCTDEYTISCEE